MGVELTDMSETNSSTATPEYIQNAKFTSEIYKIEIKNMPKKIGFGEMKEYLQKKGVKAHKVKLIKGFHTQCYVTFLSEEDKTSAMEIVETLVLKGRQLTVHHAVPHK